jgi:DegV family protein with EDD domain
MEIEHLDAHSLHSAFITACDFVISNREYLNSINVFPVADGDTGDNMSATALSVIHHSSIKPTLSATFQSIAQSALLGARGNSGMIFSQFFSGLTEIPLGADKIDTRTFAELITKASISVRSAILHPVEGTIITVIDAWSASMNKLAKEFTCFKKLINLTLSEAYQALQSTATTLPILKSAQVVDAGALGFYHFITGFANYLTNPRALDKNQSHLECTDSHHEVILDGLPPLQRFCTEITISGKSIDRISTAKQLEQFGDSVVSSGNAELYRFHLHCTEPAKVFASLFNVGTIIQSKAEDMLRQYQMLHQRKYPIALVTDSSADIPQDLLDTKQIHIIQLNMQLDDHHLIDRIGVNQDSFYEHLSSLKAYPKTSFPSHKIIEGQIRHLASHYEQVLVLPISQALSGTHDAIVKAASGFENTHVINSRATSGSLGLLVAFAARLIESGCSINEIKKELLAKIAKTNIFIYVNHFDSLIRSGRISKIGGRIAQLAHVKPIITLDSLGKAVLFDKAFSETKALSKLVNYVEELRNSQTLDTYGIVHAGVPEKALDFAKLTEEALSKPPAFIEFASTAIGLHAGKGCIAIASMMQ